MVCRMSKSFLRFGSFQLPSTRPEDVPLVKRLADYAIAEHFSHLEGGWAEASPRRTAHSCCTGETPSTGRDLDTQEDDGLRLVLLSTYGKARNATSG